MHERPSEITVLMRSSIRRRAFRKMRLLSAVIASAVTVVLVMAYGCGESVPDERLKIGFLDIDNIDHVMLRVPENELGSAHQAAMLAIKQVNEAGGVWGKPVEAVYQDTFGWKDGTRWDEPVRVANEVLDANVHVIVGPLQSSATDEIFEGIDSERFVPTVALSAGPITAHEIDDGYLFRVMVADVAQGIALARLATEEHDEHVALVHRDNSWGIGLAETFKTHYEGRITDISIHPADDSYSDELHQIAATGADALVLIDGGLPADDVLSEVRDEGHFEHILLLHIHHSKALLDRFPVLLDGARGVARSGGHITEAEGHWEADFEAEFGHVPAGSYAREVYDATLLVMLAAEHAGSSDREAIRDSLLMISRPPGTLYPATSAGVVDALAAVRNGDDIDLDGESSKIDWDDEGVNNIGHFIFWQFQNGAIVNQEHFELDIRE